MQEAGIGGCIVNGTSEGDWEAVARLAESFPDFIRPAFGLHPWYAGQRTDGWLQNLEAYLDRFPNASIGECGVDGWVPEPSLETQREVFLPQLAIARERKLPLTIHALKAWEPLFEAFEQEPPPEKFLMHSYGGSPELAKRLIPMGASFSFSGYFLQPRKMKVVDTFRSIPLDRLLIETDAPDMMPPAEFQERELGEQNHPANLKRIATGLAERLGIDLAELSRRTAANHQRFFGL